MNDPRPVDIQLCSDIKSERFSKSNSEHIEISLSKDERKFTLMDSSSPEFMHRNRMWWQYYRPYQKEKFVVKSKKGKQWLMIINH